MGRIWTSRLVVTRLRLPTHVLCIPHVDAVLGILLHTYHLDEIGKLEQVRICGFGKVAYMTDPFHFGADIVNAYPITQPCYYFI